MTQPGWYPDQAGGPDMKYWDGTAWHDAMPTAPASPGPFPSEPFQPATPPADSSNRKWIWWMVGSVLALAVISQALPTIAGLATRNSAASSPGTAATAPSVEATYKPDDQIDMPIAVHAGGGMRPEAWGVVTVRGLEQVASNPSPYIPVAGTLYSVNVLVESAEGNFAINPLSFSARTEQGTNLRPSPAAGRYQLPATELPKGQKVSGWLIFDVPTGQHIAEIILNDVVGKQLARWTVSPDPASTTATPNASSTPTPAAASPVETETAPVQAAPTATAKLYDECTNFGAMATGADGTTYYCAQIGGTEGYIWALAPGRGAPNPYPRPGSTCSDPGSTSRSAVYGPVTCKAGSGGGWSWQPGA